MARRSQWRLWTLSATLIVLLRAGWTAVMAVVPRNGSARQLAPRELTELNSEAPAHPGRQSRPGHDRRRKSLLHGASRPNGSTPATRRGQAAAFPLTGVTLQTFQRWWFENSFDELKNHWGWGGFTTHDLVRCRMMARIVALVFNWWNLFVRLADPDHHREAITSRPLLGLPQVWGCEHQEGVFPRLFVDRG